MSNEPYRHCPMCGGTLQLQHVAHEPVDHPVCDECGYVFYLDPKVAAGIIPVGDNGIVLLRRAIRPALGKWVFPGGFVNRGEEVRSAAERELREEIGVNAEAGDLVGLYSYTDVTTIVIVFEARNLAGEPTALDEALEVQAFGPEAIPWTDLAFSSTRHALLDWISRNAPECVPGDASFYDRYSTG